MYEPLKIDFTITEELKELIDQYVHYLNTGEGIADDYYRTEIQLELNACYRNHEMTDEQINLLREYYQHKGILKGNKNV